MDRVKVTLGGRDYEIEPLRYKKSQAWRRQLSEKIDGIANVFSTVIELEIDSAEDIALIVTEAKSVLLDSMEDVFDLLMEYSPDLKKDREFIEEQAYDQEIVDAFIEVVKLAFPFIEPLRKLSLIGLDTQKTSKN